MFSPSFATLSLVNASVFPLKPLPPSMFLIVSKSFFFFISISLLLVAAFRSSEEDRNRRDGGEGDVCVVNCGTFAGKDLWLWATDVRGAKRGADLSWVESWINSNKHSTDKIFGPSIIALRPQVSGTRSKIGRSPKTCRIRLEPSILIPFATKQLSNLDLDRDPTVCQ